MKTEACENCGSDLEFRQEGRTEGAFCKNCGWSVVTSDFSPLERDETTYEVRVANGDPHNQAHTKAVAHASGVNFLAARDLLEQGDPLVCKGKATKVAELRRLLQEAGLQLHIQPPFPY